MLKDYLLNMWNPFYRARVFFDICFNKETEITAIDFISSAKNINKIPIDSFKREELKSGKLVFNSKNGCWSLERKVKGKVIAGMFYPNEGQSVKYKIKM